MADSISSQPALDFIGAVSKDEAIKAGKKRYRSGEPCKYGHTGERWVCDDACVECHLMHRRERYEQDREKFTAGQRKWRNSSKGRSHVQTYNRKWADANPEKVLANRERAKERHQRRMAEDRAYAENYRAANRVKNVAAKQKRNLKRAGEPPPEACELCATKSEEICFDHCHNTGKFRGWLCHTCNRLLGLANDSPELLRKLADYLEKHKQ